MKWYSPSQVWPQTMCHTHSWPQYSHTKRRMDGLPVHPSFGMTTTQDFRYFFAYHGPYEAWSPCDPLPLSPCWQELRPAENSPSRYVTDWDQYLHPIYGRKQQLRAGTELTPMDVMNMQRWKCLGFELSPSRKSPYPLIGLRFLTYGLGLYKQMDR